MTLLTRLYHAAVGIPDDISGPEGGSALRYTVHAVREAQHESIADMLPATLPMTYELVEVETFAGKPVKWVVRTRLDATRDLVLVVHYNYQVRTVWVNQTTDRHATLNRSRYMQPQPQEVG